MLACAAEAHIVGTFVIVGVAGGLGRHRQMLADAVHAEIVGTH